VHTAFNQPTRQRLVLLCAPHREGTLRQGYCKSRELRSGVRSSAAKRWGRESKQWTPVPQSLGRDTGCIETHDPQFPPSRCSYSGSESESESEYGGWRTDRRRVFRAQQPGSGMIDASHLPTVSKCSIHLRIKQKPIKKNRPNGQILAKQVLSTSAYKTCCLSFLIKLRSPLLGPEVPERFRHNSCHSIPNSAEICGLLLGPEVPEHLAKLQPVDLLLADLPTSVLLEIHRLALHHR